MFDKMVAGAYNNPIIENGVDDMAFDQSKYINDYAKQNYDRVSVQLPKGKKDILKHLATAYNITDDKGKISVNRLIIEAIEEKYKIDLSKP